MASGARAVVDGHWDIINVVDGHEDDDKGDDGHCNCGDRNNGYDKDRHEANVRSTEMKALVERINSV